MGLLEYLLESKRVKFEIYNDSQNKYVEAFLSDKQLKLSKDRRYEMLKKLVKTDLEEAKDMVVSKFNRDELEPLEELLEMDSSFFQWSDLIIPYIFNVRRKRRY